MWWECSECGARIERTRAAALCRNCGTAGAIFVPADTGIEGDPEADSLRDAWLGWGLSRAASRGRPDGRLPRLVA